MSLPPNRIRFTPEEYLRFERASESKHEYIDGFIYAMAGGSPPHNQIGFNTIGELRLQLKGSRCRGFTSDQKILTDPQDLFSYPDITLVCGEPIFHDQHKDVILNPKVIIEVLSPSTESHDRVEKFARDQRIKTLTDYILIAQDHPSIEHFARQKSDGKWRYSLATGLTSELAIASIKCKLKLADIYDLITFPPPKPALVPLPAEVVKEELTTVKPRRRKKR